MGVGFGGMGSPGRRAAIQRQRIFFFGGSVVLFVVLVIGAVFITQSQSVARSNVSSEPQEEVTLGTIVLIAANSKIPKGTKITAANIREVHWPRDQVPEGAARTAEDVENMFSTVALPENQPILRSSLSATQPQFGIGELLPPGHRAVTINVNATTGVEGWATAGAHVDILLTYLDPKDGENKTRVVMENAIVLSFGGNAKARDTDEHDRTTSRLEISTVTLAVPFQDSLKIQTALAMGRITLALRNKDDVGTQADTTFEQNEFDKKVKAAPQQASKAAPKGFAKIPGKNGSEQQFVLDGDRWQSDSPESLF